MSPRPPAPSAVPGPRSRELWRELRESCAPMGPRFAQLEGAEGIVLARGEGSLVSCVDGNSYVDLAGGFGSLLLGHGHPGVQRVLAQQAEQLVQALGDVYPSEAKITLATRLGALHPSAQGQVIFSQSGADALTAALKTALLINGRPGVLSFAGAYHGLSYAPLAITDLRPSYRLPFAGQLATRVHFLPFPNNPAEAQESLRQARGWMKEVGALVFEPIQGRAGVVPPPAGFLAGLCELAREHDVVSIADEVWTGLGRAGSWLHAVADGATPDLICLGKGLGGGLPISACVGPREMMQTWSREEEVVHTSTFSGAPLAASTALETLRILETEGLVERSRAVGGAFRAELEQCLRFEPRVRVRGQGLMIGVDLGGLPGQGAGLQRALLERGFLTTTGGGRRNVLVLTPALNVPEQFLGDFAATLADVLR